MFLEKKNPEKIRETLFSFIVVQLPKKAFLILPKPPNPRN